MQPQAEAGWVSGGPDIDKKGSRFTSAPEEYSSSHMPDFNHDRKALNDLKSPKPFFILHL